jgi:hypothetical protein
MTPDEVLPIDVDITIFIYGSAMVRKRFVPLAVLNHRNSIKT